MKCFYWVLAGFVLPIAGCNHGNHQEQLDRFSEGQLVTWNQKLTQVFITDVLTPPVCSRGYAYANIAAYEVFRQPYPGYPSYAGQLNGLESIPVPDSIPGDYNFSVAGIIAFNTVAKKMVFNNEALAKMEEIYLHQLDSLGMAEDILEHSITYGRLVGQHVIDWASKDGYLQRNANPGYIVTKQYGRWLPTPPDYTDAIEPNWHRLRPFTIDSVSQFRPGPPSPVDTTPGSRYYKDALQVYEAVNQAKGEHLAMAKFWDCNPNISVTQGHVVFFQQKISPGGHWISIAGSVCTNEKYNEIKTAEILSKVAIAIADGFMSCWEAKYHYNMIRPETIINRYIDKDWRPLLQTPPFPEYPSGHSVVSGAAATVLSSLAGETYRYTDSTELPFGMPPRSFQSFNQAALEASVSRMYGGIHYMPSLDSGIQEGRNIANYVLYKLNKPSRSLHQTLKQAGMGE